MKAVEVLARAAADIAVFLEFSDEDTVDADSAVAQLEQLSARLQELDTADRQALVSVWRSLASTCQDNERARFVLELAENLGLLDEAGPPGE